VNNEILCRDDASLKDVDVKQRLITVLAVPWEQEAEVVWRGEQWKEVFTRGAFNGLEDHAGRVRVNRQHTKGMTVGKAVQFDTQDQDGLVARIRVAKTDLGDETLALADEDMIGPSIGFLVKNPADVILRRQSMLRRVNRAFLDHISLVESPAYNGAKVLSVREAPNGLTVAEIPLPETPILDEFMSDDVLKWALGRKSSA
jgi:HK97 family phage prohead protease